ncbi:MAG: fumarylacetoacetate hydrolase family protein [Methylocystaceae bacterium]|nr:fumarylacetoacetate hydrolase family protein [Methylocystaceae bacterium]
MKLVRFGDKGSEKAGIIDDTGAIRSLEGHLDDITPQSLSDDVLDKLRTIDLESLDVVEGARIGTPISNIGKIVCIGLNYSDHAAEADMEVPPEPVIFMKATSAINGPDDDVILPRGSQKTDWECELAIVIGKEAKYVSEEDTFDYVAGYTILNDISERAFQIERAGQWVKGKSCDTFAPIGPWLVTRDEVLDPQNLSMWLDVNGKRFQEGTTETMVYGVRHLVSYLSQFMSLQPGDVISTGTPPGVGMGQNPAVYLKDGDVMSLGIQGLGVQTQKVISDT